MKKINRIRLYSFAIIGLFIILTNSCKKDDNNNIPLTVKDIDGNVYHTVIIGTQVWLVENLKTTKYRNGDPIPYVTDYYEWRDIKTGAYSYYEDTSLFRNIYGNLYNWYTVKDSRNIAPVGWHVPNDTEWSILINYLGGDSIAGYKLKETGISHWYEPNTDATNSSGFTALPGGICNDQRQFANLYGNASWWSTTIYDTNEANAWTINYGIGDVYFMRFTFQYGLSIRCIKDK